MNQSTVTGSGVLQLALPPSRRLLTLPEAAELLARPPEHLTALLLQQWDRVRDGEPRRPWDLVLPVPADPGRPLLQQACWREHDLLLWSWRTGWHPVGMTGPYGYTGPVIGYVGLALWFGVSAQWLRKLNGKPEGLPTPRVKLRAGPSTHNLYDPAEAAQFGRQNRKLAPDDTSTAPPWPVIS